MKTLNQFKQEEKIANIELLQGNGRRYAKVNNKDVIVSSKADMAKPLFVTELTTDEQGNARQTPLYVICNAQVKVVATV